MSNFKSIVPADLFELYEILDVKHAAAVLHIDFPREFAEICDTLRRFRFKEKWVTDPGGSESEIPREFSRLLRPNGWTEPKLEADSATSI